MDEELHHSVRSTEKRQHAGFNILKDSFPDRYIEKRHAFQPADPDVPVVVTYRHPLDCIASSILRYELAPTDEVVDQQISEFEKNGIWDVLAIKDDPNVLLLRYEDFVFDFEVIFRGIENFFHVKIPPAARKVLTDRYRIKLVEKTTRKMKTFSEYDKRTEWHGKHISKYRGAPYYYKEFFRADQISHLENVYKDFLEAFHYQ